MSANGLHPEHSVPSQGPEPAADLPTPSRRRFRCSPWAALAVGLALLAIPTGVHALSCISSGAVVMMLCQDGDCIDGFQVRGRRIRNGHCSTRPEVRNLSDQQRVHFGNTIRRSEGRVSDGIYQLRDGPNCIEYGWRNRSCSETPSISRLNDTGDAPTLARYRNEWLAKERQGLSWAAILYWWPPMLIGLLTLFSLGWPWALIALKRSLEKYIFYFAVAAMPLQAGVFWLITLFELFFVAGEPLERLRFAQACAALIPLFVALQFGYLIWRKLRPAAR